MSTRAIVGYKRSDGTVVGAWCWNDGYDIKKDLKRDFKSLLDVNFLLEVGMFSTIYSKKEYEDFVSWAKKGNIDMENIGSLNFGAFDLTALIAWINGLIKLIKNILAGFGVGK